MSDPKPPVAKQVPVTRERFGESAVDEYVWLRDRNDPDLLPLLEAENAYTEAVLAPLRELRERIFGEIKARTQETDLSVPHRKGGWWYYSRTEEGAPYGIHCRRPDDGTGTAMLAEDEGGAEQVMLDENALAKGHEYQSLGVGEVSPDGNLLAYSVDHDGDERHVLHVRDLTTGAALDEAIEGTSYGFAWAADSRTAFYTTIDEAERPWRAHRHVIGDLPDGSTDALVHQEDDERFFVGVGASRSGDLVVIELGSKVTSEIWLIDAHDPTARSRVVEARRQGIEYSVAHHGADLYVLSNDDAPNFALWKAPLESPGRDHWQPVIAHRDDTRLGGVEAFASRLVVHVRRSGVTGLRALDPATGATRDLTFDEEVRSVSPGVNEEYDSTAYRFGYQSLITPATVFEEDLVTGERRLLKQQPVLGDFEPAEYESARVWATADDGTEVPMSVVWKRSVARRDGSDPCLLYGYGSYEISMDPWFSIARLSLLDRGVVFAVAHVRGGGELGRQWYEDGKLLAKPNTFGDFVACARHLVDAGWTSADRLVARGGSAGGLLMGAVANAAPDLFRAIIAEVPFVDALNTILDPTLPLTVIEWEEWGNPLESEDVFRCMRGYTPFENIVERRYPAILATGGLNDPRVGYHEPVKWVQRLRRTVTSDDDRPVLLQMELGAGHGGPSGRYDAWRHEALLLSFALWQMRIAE